MKIIQNLIFGAALLLSSQAYAFNVDSYMAQQCSSCHGTEYYTRSDRKINSLGALKTHLRDRCNHVVTEKMNGQMLDAVVNHLNKKYYKF